MEWKEGGEAEIWGGELRLGVPRGGRLRTLGKVVVSRVEESANHGKDQLAEARDVRFPWQSGVQGVSGRVWRGGLAG